MPWKLSYAEYNLLDEYMQMIVSHLQEGLVSLQDAQEGVMQPLTAWETDKPDQFGPMMEKLLSPWEAEDADENEDEEESSQAVGEDEDDET